MGDGDGVLVEGFKWPDTRYRALTMQLLGSDSVGTWLWTPRGTRSIYDVRGTEPLPVDFLTLLPAGADAERWWVATWMFGGEIDLYVDVVMPPVWVVPGRHLRIVDLDLDVIRWNDGRVMIDDEDEFSVHQSVYGYPPDVVARARRCADDVLALVAARTPPFGPPPEHWSRVTSS